MRPLPMCPSTAGARRPCWQGRDLGIERGLALNAFPGGPEEMIEYHSRLADRRMVEAYEASATEGLKLRQKVALAIRLRLAANTPHREAIRRALSILALPIHAPLVFDLTGGVH